MSGVTIAWERDKLADLKAAYDEAVATRTTPFTYEEKAGFGYFRKVVARHSLDVRYAKFLIAYLDSQMVDQPKQPYNEGEEGQ